MCVSRGCATRVPAVRNLRRRDISSDSQRCVCDRRRRAVNRMRDSADGSQRRAGFICGRAIDTRRFAAVSWCCCARDDGSMFAIAAAASGLLFEMKKLFLLLAFGLVTAWPSAAHATAIPFTAAGTSTTGTAIKATATFTVDTTANRLVVTLSNTASSDVLSPADVLTAV